MDSRAGAEPGAARPALELLTVAELAQRLGYPESWVLYYSSRYEAYLPSVRLRRGLGYRPAALAVLRCIADGLKAGQSAAALDATLAARFPSSRVPAQRPTTV